MIIERARDGTVYGSVEEVFFSKVSGNFFLEIFEKSIDKHKIDAILNAPSFSSGPIWGCLTMGEASWRIPRKNPAVYHPDTRKSDEHGRELLCAYERKRNG